MRRLLGSLMAGAIAAATGPAHPLAGLSQFNNDTNWRPGGAPGLANKGKARWKRLRRSRGG